MGSPSLPLYVAIGLLMVDSIIELSFISSMVAWLHRRAGGSFEIAYNGSSYSLHGKPVGLLVNQGHTSNGAAGTAFVLIGMGGILILWMRSRQGLGPKGFVKGLYYFWLVMTVLSALFTLAALIATFVITGNHTGQTVDQSVASQLNNQPYPNYVAYPLDFWTPEKWFNAVLKLDLVHTSDRSNINLHVAVMKGWRYNLIPMFVIGLVVACLALWDASRRRKAARYGGHNSELASKQGGSI
ncbi:hypothetical protein LTR70_007034 [Exophiala xenobiotica]|uniref:Uncharacterized protein n=1 Tax=Lithohypha guttulata TaxID=1690604 RepID=A0ABR0K5D5_9EURO|nr:hypothetical protein LTR24_006648 [Lithohypha guttulata]KAK5314672.1 hypothetical protein LTR70_007034 [Exophiala xenobiotica]